MSLETAENLFNNFRLLLEKQIELVKKKDFRSVEVLSEQTDALVTEIAKIRLPEQPELKSQWEQLIQRYKKLELMITAEKETVRGQLRKVGNGKKTIQAYH